MSQEVRVGQSVLRLHQGDITKLAVDAIVNAANPSLMGGGGVDGAIHRAGGPAILEDCKRIVAKIGRLPTGEAVITTGGNLPAKHVIHTVGPVWHGGKKGEPELLANAYRNSLKVAVEHGLERVAFPSISTGVYGYPIEEASRVAVNTVLAFVKEHGAPREVTFVLFSDGDLAVYRKRFAELSGAAS